MSTIESKCIECGHPFLVNFPDPAPAGLDVPLLRRCIEEALVDDESGMETFSAEVVAAEYDRIYYARLQPAPLTGEEP